MTDAVAHEAVGFEQFVADKGGGLMRAAWLLTGDRHHAEDLVQSALAKPQSTDELGGLSVP